MSEQSPKHQYEIQWESGGNLRSEIVGGDGYDASQESGDERLAVWYVDGQDPQEPHFELVGFPFVIQRTGE